MVKQAWWQYALFILIIVLSGLYALPNLYGDVPAVQIAAESHTEISDAALLNQVKQSLRQLSIHYQAIKPVEHSVVVQFADTTEQTMAQEKLQRAMGDGFTTSLYLLPTTPTWLTAIGAKPMRLGLDLRGGIHFLLSVDVDAVFERQNRDDLQAVGQTLRQASIRYSGLSMLKQDEVQGVRVTFRTPAALAQAHALLAHQYPSYAWKTVAGDTLALTGLISPAQRQQVRQKTLAQSITILRNRVNELGISEAVVTQQGQDQIAVDLPGIQDVAKAQSIIGKTATLAFHLLDTTHDVNAVVTSHQVPTNTILAYHDKTPYLLAQKSILQGDQIVNANANIADQGPEVSIRLAGGSAVQQFNQITAQHIGYPLAVLYIETKPVERMVKGKQTTAYRTEQRIINIATINSALGNQFRITGLGSMQEASELALLLRAGALPVPIHIASERVIGPSLGAHNITQGLHSVVWGFILVIIFMAIYYRLFGMIANIALALNLILIVAIMSLLGAVLTLPGIAGIVLTVGMAVDANVLIFERIREEIRTHSPPLAAIASGYARAFKTIVDANVTTLIVAVVLFSLGSGPVKGFAITLTIGLMTSMITALWVTKVLLTCFYWRKPKRLSIGIKPPAPIAAPKAANT